MAKTMARLIEKYLDQEQEIATLHADIAYEKQSSEYLRRELDSRSSIWETDSLRTNLAALQARYDSLLASIAFRASKDPVFDDMANVRRNKIPTIKAIRETYGLGLKEAKDVVDQRILVDDLSTGAALQFEDEDPD